MIGAGGSTISGGVIVIVGASGTEITGGGGITTSTGIIGVSGRVPMVKLRVSEYGLLTGPAMLTLTRQ